MNLTKDRDIREDVFTRATLIINGATVPNIPCEVFLPKRPTDKPHLIFRPSEKQFQKIAGAGRAILRSVVHPGHGTVGTSMAAPCVYLSYNSPRSRTKYANCKIDGQPENLCLTTYSGRKRTRGEASYVAFWISENRFLTPPHFFTSSYDGSRRRKTYRYHHFYIMPGLHLRFDVHYTDETKEGELHQLKRLVGKGTIKIPAKRGSELAQSLLPAIDDLLLIVSFATRHRTACLGWRIIDGESDTSYYRGHYAFPEECSRRHFLDAVVDEQFFDKFVVSAFRALKSHPSPNSIRNAIYSLMPERRIPLQWKFMTLFSAFEGVLSGHARKMGLQENIGDPSKRKTLCKVVRECVRQRLNYEEYLLVAAKLPELNRPPLKELFKAFCAKYEVPIDDLWPAFSDGQGIGLSKIRNDLVHGQESDNYDFDALVAAEFHLQWLLERLIVRSLGWPIDQTQVRPGCWERHCPALESWKLTKERMEARLAQRLKVP